MSKPKKKASPFASCVGMPEHLKLDAACILIYRAFGETPWLVGSSLNTCDYRDVDVRLILDDDKYERLFGKTSSLSNAYWVLSTMAISEYLKNATGLPIDFQIQKRSKIKKEDWEKPRFALGCHVNTEHPPWWDVEQKEEENNVEEDT